MGPMKAVAMKVLQRARIRRTPIRETANKGKWFICLLQDVSSVPLDCLVHGNRQPRLSFAGHNDW
jgi:hypothetical protein